MLETQYRNIEGCTSDLLRVPVVLPCEPQTIVPYVQGMKWHVHGYVWPTAGVVVFGLSILLGLKSEQTLQSVVFCSDHVRMVELQSFCPVVA